MGFLHCVIIIIIAIDVVNDIINFTVAVSLALLLKFNTDSTSIVDLV